MSEPEKKGRNYPAMLVVATLLALVIVVFALQNAETVVLKFFSASMTVTKAFLIFICLAIGIIVGILFSLPGNLRKGNRARKAERELKTLKSQLTVSKSRATEQEEPSSKKDQA